MKKVAIGLVSGLVLSIVMLVGAVFALDAALSDEVFADAF